MYRSHSTQPTINRKKFVIPNAMQRVRKPARSVNMKSPMQMELDSLARPMIHEPYGSVMLQSGGSGQHYLNFTPRNQVKGAKIPQLRMFQSSYNFVQPASYEQRSYAYTSRAGTQQRQQIQPKAKFFTKKLSTQSGKPLQRKKLKYLSHRTSAGSSPNRSQILGSSRPQKKQ